MNNLHAYPLELSYFVNTQEELTEVEKEEIIAFAALNHLRSLGRLTTLIAPSSRLTYLEEAPRGESTAEQLQEMDEAFQTLGTLQMMVAERLHDALYKITRKKQAVSIDDSKS